MNDHMSSAEYRRIMKLDSNTTFELGNDSFGVQHKSKKNKSDSDDPNEYEECKQLKKYLDGLVSVHKIVKYAHLVNELKIDREKGQKPNFNYLAARKAEGWKPGVPDYLIVLPKSPGLLFIEMKKEKGNKASDAQLEWLEAINKAGGYTAVCNGHKEAQKCIERFL